MTRLTIDELEVLTPDQLAKISFDEVRKDFPDVQYIHDLLYVGCSIEVRTNNDLTDIYMNPENGLFALRNSGNQTLLHIAAESGHIEVLGFLLSKGAYVDIRDALNRTALHSAVNYGELERGPTYLRDDGSEYYGLRWGTTRGRLDVAKFLISKGADVNARDIDGRIPLHRAAWWGNIEIVKLLISKGADIHAKNDCGVIAWDLANGETRKSCPELDPKRTIDELKILTPDELGKLLWIEIRSNYNDVQHIQNLLDVGCPIDARDRWGQTPLHFTATHSRYNTLEVLVHNGADINARDNSGWTPLHWAANSGTFDMMKFLISKGADINARNNEGLSAVEIAMMRRLEDPEKN